MWNHGYATDHGYAKGKQVARRGIRHCTKGFVGQGESWLCQGESLLHHTESWLHQGNQEISYAKDRVPTGMVPRHPPPIFLVV